MLIKIKTSRFCRVCNRRVAEQCAQVFLKLTTSTKPNYFPNPREAWGCCKNHHPSLVPAQPLSTGSGISPSLCADLRMGPGCLQEQILASAYLLPPPAGTKSSCPAVQYPCPAQGSVPGGLYWCKTGARRLSGCAERQKMGSVNIRHSRSI